ncbi:MAG: hypothetical protein NVSMB19_13830 [Vulcanimicrobiaceae bacterium]
MQPDNRPRVAILGAGAMGTLFAYYLAERNAVTLVDVRGDVVETINAHGGVAIDDLPIRKVAATRDAARAFATDFLFVFVKAPNTLAGTRPFDVATNRSCRIGVCDRLRYPAA